MALTCPHCAVEMQEVKATATTGYLLVLDQCRRCGGIWADRWEAFPLSTVTVERLDSVDTATLQAPPPPGGAAPARLECPRCQARMYAFTDPTLPPDARIERCRNCEGMWFNRGELRRFKHRTAQRTPPITAAQLDHLAQTVGCTTTLPTVSHLDDAMRAAPEDPADDVRGQLAGAAVWLVVRTILRLLFGV